VTPGRINADDLDKSTRKRLGVDKATAKAKGKAKGKADPYSAHCSTCGDTFASEAAANRHARQLGHRRTVWDLPD
jgi:hypothetical protein